MYTQSKKNESQYVIESARGDPSNSSEVLWVKAMLRIKLMGNTIMSTVVEALIIPAKKEIEIDMFCN